MDELTRLRKLYAELSIKYQNLETRVRHKTPRVMRRWFITGAAVGLMVGFLLGTAIARGH